jgi:pseudouridine-5'-phosphate glycosidase
MFRNCDVYVFSAEVAEGLACGGAVVALESTVLAHGLPWPENLQTARAMEQAVREGGAVPATIAVIEGVIKVGLSDAELELVAESARQGPDLIPKESEAAGRPSVRFAKAGRRDLGVIVARRGYAATTVSATLWVCRHCGLDTRVMATGGLGGVHRGAATSFDVSTDLDELRSGDGALVVCSGFKSILDQAATLEALETRGVPVIGYRTGELAGFTARTTGLALEHRVESPEEAAAVVQAHRRLGLPGALVLAQPAPEGVAVDSGLMERAVADALQAASAMGVSGKQLTPFLLERVVLATGGRSLEANCALLVANAGLAGQVARALHA